MLPIAGSKYQFGIRRFVPSGNLVENYRSSDGKGGVPALRFEAIGTGGTREAYWVKLGGERTAITENGRVLVRFYARSAGPDGGGEWTHTSASPH
jgi:hypothetical protein